MKALYLNTRFFILLAAITLCFLMAFVFPWLLGIGKVGLLVLASLTLIDIFILFRLKKGLLAQRETQGRLSNGDKNPIFIAIENRYAFSIGIRVIDEIPFQFQERNFLYNTTIDAGLQKKLRYVLRPVKRGEYEFGTLNIYVSGIISLVSRRYRFNQNKNVAVYPSFLQMRKYEILAISNRLTQEGIKKIRRIGHNREFEQIKEYVQGDDIRTINWKATARKNLLMVNHYQDEKSQQIYSVIDKGRVMKMPFEEMSLLDYAINSSLVLSNIAMLKQDKAGVITFNHQVGTILPAQRSPSQLQKILETLYKQKTAYKESDFEPLYITIKRKITQRSLIVLYTNFETLSGMERQLPYLKNIAKSHVLVVVFFENTELKTLLEKPAVDTEEIYLKAIAEKFAFEKKMIVKELKRHGIFALLTTPQNLTANTINQYLQLKARGLF